MIQNLRIFETCKNYGNMTTKSDFYPEGMSKDEIQKDFLSRRIGLGEHFGFDGRKMIVAHQKKRGEELDYPDGQFKIITPELVESVEDTWQLDIPADILILTTETPRVAVGYPVADCPVIIMEDQKKHVSALAHCGAEYVDRHLPEAEMEALHQAFGSKPSDIKAYISACAGPTWTYDAYPIWATDDDVWENAITIEKSLYRIDIRKAIIEQFAKMGITNFIVNKNDTITDDRFYSNSEASKGKTMKKGRHFAGGFYRGQK